MSFKNFAYRLMVNILIIIVISLILGLTLFGWKNSPPQSLFLGPQAKLIQIHLEEIVKYLSEDIGNRNYVNYEQLNMAADYIVGQFQKLGYEPQIQIYEIQKKMFKNIFIEKKGYDPTLPKILVGGHYDTCFNPGADDNASGIAGLMELARLLKEKNLRSTIQFVAFVNEEPPFFMTELMGSRVFVKELKKRRERIKGVLILEMIGFYTNKKYSQRYFPFMGPFYPNQGNFIALVGNLQSHRLVSRIVKAYGGKQNAVALESLIAPGFIPGINFSDHWSFWREGYPAVMITDTAFFRNSSYHTSLDRFTTLDYQRMALVILRLKDVIITLSDD